jgi:hypothetical protein
MLTVCTDEEAAGTCGGWLRGNAAPPDPLGSAPLTKSTVREQLAPDVGIHPYWTDRKLLLDRKPAAEPPRVLAVDESGIDAAAV